MASQVSMFTCQYPCIPVLPLYFVVKKYQYTHSVPVNMFHIQTDYNSCHTYRESVTVNTQ